jgi:hypothetical protein
VTRVLGVEVPTSILALADGRSSWRYMAQPSRMDSYGINELDWPHPTALSFETKTMVAEKLAAAGSISAEPVPPDAMLYAVESVLRMSTARIAHLLNAKDKVAERRSLLSELIPGSFGQHGIRTRCVAWPTIPGVTTRHEDTTR